jgi:hypothetical protein
MNAIFTFVLDHAFSWLKILIVFVILDFIFRSVVAIGWLDGILSFAWYMENVALFKIFPEIAITYVVNMFMLVISVEVLFLVFGRKHLPANPHEQHS